METTPLPLKKVLVKKVTSNVVGNIIGNAVTKPKKNTTLKATTSKNNIDINTEKQKNTKKKIVKTKIEFPKVGQIKPTPPANDSLTKFYTSLLVQNPKSEMAKKWCIEHGLYPGQPDNISLSLSKLSLS